MTFSEILKAFPKKQSINISSPLKSTTKGLFSGFQVFITKTAFEIGDVVVAGIVVVVTSGSGVVAMQSNSLQGQPAAQFSCYQG